MRAATLTFFAASLCLLTASRLLLCAWHWDRVRAAGGLWPIIKGGLRIDLTMVAMIGGLPLLLSPWLGHEVIADAVTETWLMTGWTLLVVLETLTPQFIAEYDSRPNRLFFEYFKHPKEVAGMLWKGYKPVIVGAVLVITALVWIGHVLFDRIRVDAPLPLWQQALYTLAAAPLVFLAIRGTLAHRPINPSSVAYCSDGMLNTLPLNSLYNVLYAVYSLKNERSAQDVYGKLPPNDMILEVNRHAGIESLHRELPSLHVQTPAHTRSRPLNLVMIVEESLGAQYVARLGGRALTPHIDALMEESWNFTHAYATGTRSVRGLEALVAGFPPTLSDAALRLSGAQRNFFTLAQVLKLHGYRSRFVYGGEAHFDNMKSFFLGNGFDELHDAPSFENPAFVGTWGASDEDMFAKLDALLNASADEPTFTLAFSVSNHSPWEYPPGRIIPDGHPATADNSVRYADWALGKFFEKAKRSEYWRNTVFLVVADHDSRVHGANLVPLKHFHIPAFILGADIPARADHRIVSQIDLPVTLLSLMGISCEHPMIGHDLTHDTGGGRAMMQYGENYGYLKEDQLLVLTPHKAPRQYRYTAPDEYVPVTANSALFKEALSHVLWPSWAYKNNAYTLPALRAHGAAAMAA